MKSSISPKVLIPAEVNSTHGIWIVKYVFQTILEFQTSNSASFPNYCYFMMWTLWVIPEENLRNEVL